MDDANHIVFLSQIADEFAAQGKRILDPDCVFLVRGVSYAPNGIELMFDVSKGPGEIHFPGGGVRHLPDRQTLMQLLARTYRVRTRRADPTTFEIPVMPDDWWKAARAAYPILRGAEFGSGWGDLILSMADWLSEIAPEMEPFSQTKEKYGELRLYFGPGDGLAQEIVDSAEYLSGYLCDCCGAPGENKEVRGWMATRCDKHRHD